MVGKKSKTKPRKFTGTFKFQLITINVCICVCTNLFEGLYRGNIVAVKQILKRSVDLTRAIRKELKQMREV